MYCFWALKRIENQFHDDWKSCYLSGNYGFHFISNRLLCTLQGALILSDYKYCQHLPIHVTFQTINLPAPYGNSNCVEADKSNFKFNLKYFKYYSKAACSQECLTNYVFEECGCRGHFQNGKETSYIFACCQFYFTFNNHYVPYYISNLFLHLRLTITFYSGFTSLS